MAMTIKGLRLVGKNAIVFIHGGKSVLVKKNEVLTLDMIDEKRFEAYMGTPGVWAVISKNDGGVIPVTEEPTTLEPKPAPKNNTPKRKPKGKE